MSVENTNDSGDKEDQDWLNVLAGRSVNDADPQMVEETQQLREALLRQHYEKTLEDQPDSALQGMLTQLAEEGYVKTLPEPPTSTSENEKKLDSVDDKKTFWQLFFAYPVIPFATACFMVLLNMPLYFSYWNKSNTDEVMLIAKSTTNQEVKSDINPLATATEFALDLHKIGIKTHLKPEENGWLVSFRIEIEPNKQSFQKLKALLDSREIRFSITHYPFEKTILFLPLIEGKPIKVYSLKNQPLDIVSSKEVAKNINDKFEALGIKTKINEEENFISVDLWFPNDLSDDMFKIMDEYGLQAKLLTSKFRHLRIVIFKK